MFNIPSHQEMEVKTTLRFYPTPVRMAKIKAQVTADAGKDMEKGILLHFWWDFKLDKTFWKSVWLFLR